MAFRRASTIIAVIVRPHIHGPIPARNALRSAFALPRPKLALQFQNYIIGDEHPSQQYKGVPFASWHYRQLVHGDARDSIAPLVDIGSPYVSNTAITFGTSSQVHLPGVDPNSLSNGTNVTGTIAFLRTNCISTLIGTGGQETIGNGIVPNSNNTVRKTRFRHGDFA
jgi:hypothetical protein